MTRLKVAEVRRGSRRDAFSYAVAHGTAQRKLTIEDVEKHVLREYRR